MKIHYGDDVYLDVIDVTLNQVGQKWQAVTPAGQIIPPDDLAVNQISQGGYAMLFGKATTGEPINEGDLVAVDNNGKLWKADKDIPGKQNLIGIATENGNAGVEIKYQTSGVFTRTTGSFTGLGRVYMGNNGALLFGTTPTTGISITAGYVMNSTDLVIQIISRTELT